MAKRMGAAVTFSFIVLGSALAWGTESGEGPKKNPLAQHGPKNAPAEQPRKEPVKSAASEGKRIARKVFSNMPDPIKGLKSPLENLRWAFNLTQVCTSRDSKNPEPYVRGLAKATTGEGFTSNDVFESVKAYVTEKADPNQSASLFSALTTDKTLQNKAKFWHLLNLPDEDAKQLNIFDQKKGKEACDAMKNISGDDIVKSKAVMARSLSEWSKGSLGAEGACGPITERTDAQIQAVLKTACDLQTQLDEKREAKDNEAVLAILDSLFNLRYGKTALFATGMTAANQILDSKKPEDRAKTIKEILDHEQLSEKSSLQPSFNMLIANGYIPEEIAKEIAKAKEGLDKVIGNPENLEKKLTALKTPSVTISNDRVAFKDANGKLFVGTKDYLNLNKEMEDASKAGKLTPEMKAKVFANIQEVDPKTGALTAYTPEKMVADRQAAQAAEQAKIDAEPVKPGEEKHTNWSGVKIQRGQKLRDSWNVEKIVRDPKMGKDALLVQFKHPQFAEGAVYSWTAGPQAGWVFWRRHNPEQVCYARPGQHFTCPSAVARR